VFGLKFNSLVGMPNFSHLSKLLKCGQTTHRLAQTRLFPVTWSLVTKRTLQLSYT